MTLAFEHRCPATTERRDERGRITGTYQSCRTTQSWELYGLNPCISCGHVPDAEWRATMAGKLGIIVEPPRVALVENETSLAESDEAEASPPSTAGTGRRGRRAEAETEA